MKFTVLMVFVSVLFCDVIYAIDELGDNEYDVEIEDDVDIIQAMEEQYEGDSYSELADILSSMDKNQISRPDEYSNEDEIGSDEHVTKLYNDALDHSFLARLNNLLEQIGKEYKISAPYNQNGKCAKFRSSRNAVHKCSSKKTMFGKILYCHVTCKAGFHLAHVIPHYELCGAATKWRWSYELKGQLHATETCLQGKGKVRVPSACTTTNCMATAAYYINKIDYSVKPCDDFFQYSCGRWLKESKVPDGSRGKYLTYSVIRNRVKWNMAKLLEKPINSSECSAVRKAKTVYQSCMDTDLINHLDAQPLLDFLQADLAWPVIDDDWSSNDFNLESTLATLRGHYHNNVLFTIAVAKSNGIHILQTWKGKMAMPNAYYIEPRYSNRKNAYFSLMKDTAVMLGADPDVAENDMKEALNFETKISMLKVVERDYFTVKSIGDMEKDIPGIEWLQLFKEMIKSYTITSNTKVEVWNVDYLRALIKLIKKTDPRIVQNYMVWRIIKHRISNLGERFQLRYLEYKKAMYGTSTLSARWRTCSNYLIFSLKEPTGKMFVDKYFSPSKKIAAERMFHNIRAGFVHLLDTEVNWMDSKTKAYAKEKALAMKSHIGYNSKFYENVTYLDNQLMHLKVNKSDYFGNVVHVLMIISQNEFKKLGETYNVSHPPETTTRPTMVNAFYSPRQNAMFLPAGEMQYPFYWGDKFPRMFQYGGIGTILGHEITHGFDNYGSKYDKNGKYNNWWTAKSHAQFQKRTKCIETQYNNYYWPTAEENLNGKKTLGENIADNGGIRESYQGYQFWLASQNLTGEEIEPATGLTNNQMFFVGFANVRCAKYTHLAAEHAIASNAHSPGRYRVIGSLQNFDKFSQAFKCKPKSYMNPEKKCILW